MASIDMSDFLHPERKPRRRIVQERARGWLLEALFTTAEQLQQRRDLKKLQRLDARLLRDMGFDPQAVHAAYDGPLDPIYGDAFSAPYPVIRDGQ